MSTPTQRPASNSESRKRAAEVSLTPDLTERLRALAAKAEKTAADDLRARVKARIKREAMDRFASEHLTDDARAWLAGFAADAAIAEMQARP